MWAVVKDEREFARRNNIPGKGCGMRKSMALNKHSSFRVVGREWALGVQNDS